MTVMMILALVLSIVPLAMAATLRGSIYNAELSLERDVLLSVNTLPRQQLLVRNGTYALELPPGQYILLAQKGTLVTQEEITIDREGSFIYDIFLLPDFLDEEDLLAETREDILEEDLKEERKPSRLWAYLLALLIVLIALYRYGKVRKKYGPLRVFRRRVKEEQQKTLEQHKEEIAREPGYLERTLETIKKHDGRITQRELRKEMLDLSEAKVSLILTELEHKGRIEKIKKGRGNVILLRPR